MITYSESAVQQRVAAGRARERRLIAEALRSDPALASREKVLEFADKVDRDEYRDKGESAR